MTVSRVWYGTMMEARKKNNSFRYFWRSLVQGLQLEKPTGNATTGGGVITKVNIHTSHQAGNGGLVAVEDHAFGAHLDHVNTAILVNEQTGKSYPKNEF